MTATLGHTMTSKGHVAKNRRYTPLIGIVNTDKLIVDEVIRILTDNELPFHIYERGSKNHPTWKNKWEIMINGMKRCRRTADVLIPYLRSAKKDRLIALRDWIDYRLGVDQKKPYTEKDAEMLTLVRQAPVMLRDYTLSPAS